jgi:hypothetical protein
MKLRFLLALILLGSASVLRADLASSIEKLRAVDREGKGNAEATEAWKEIAKSDAATLTQILAGMNGANPLAENWLRTAAGVVAEKAVMGNGISIDSLVAFLQDTKNAAAPRVLAFDLIRKSKPEMSEKLAMSLLADPSSELRRYPVTKLIEEGDAALSSDKKDAAGETFQKALVAARDEDQIKSVAKKLRDLGKAVDLPKHFGFLMKWQLVAPFTNVERKGFDEVFPPEKEINLTASYPGKGGDAKWAAFESKDDYGMIDFNKPFTMLKEVTGYAYTEFNSAEERSAEIRIGCKNGWKIWLNGELVFARDEYHRGMKLDQYKLPVRLKKGANKILVKCCQNEQMENWTVEWQFQMRICDATGTAIAEAK